MKIKEVLEYGKNNLIEKEEGLRLSKMLLKHLLKVDDSYVIINSDENVALFRLQLPSLFLASI